MNKTSETIGWAAWSWNPITGCLRLCDYCYAHRMSKRLKGRHGYSKTNPFKPTFHRDHLSEPLLVDRPSRIFVCSMGEIFDGKPEWIEDVLQVIKKCPQHIFMILTKKPECYSSWVFTDNCWLGTTVTGSNDVDRIHVLNNNTTPDNLRFASFEPLIDNPYTDRNKISTGEFEWAILGLMTGPKKTIPDKNIVENLISDIVTCQIPLYIKENVYKHYPHLPLYKEFP